MCCAGIFSAISKAFSPLNPEFPIKKRTEIVEARIKRIERILEARKKLEEESRKIPTDSRIPSFIANVIRDFYCGERRINDWFEISTSVYTILSKFQRSSYEQEGKINTEYLHCHTAIKSIQTLISRFFEKWPKADNHQHGEALIPVSEYQLYLETVGRTLHYDAKTSRVFKEAAAGTIPVSEAIQKQDLKRLMSISGCPKDKAANDFFFNVCCNMIDSITGNMSFETQNRLIVDQLVKEGHTYAPIMIDLPNLRKPPQKLVDLFNSSEFKKFSQKLKDLEWQPKVSTVETLKKRLELRKSLNAFFNKASETLQKMIPETIEAMEKEFAAANDAAKKRHGEKCPTVKYIIPVMRCQIDLAAFFQQTMEIFALIQRSKLVRGYQIVGSESDPFAKENFLIQMFIIDYCREKYKGNGSIALHTGELHPKDLPKPARIKRIFDTIHLGYIDPKEASQRKVHRISHGVTLTDEDIDLILEKDVCVEVCMTSNKELLQVFINEELTGLSLDKANVLRKAGYANPLLKLFQHGVPFTICADDPTHFGINLADELKKAVLEGGLNYRHIKNSQRVLRHYAPELDGESIYENHPDIRGLMVIKDKYKNVDKIGWKNSVKDESEKAREQIKWEQLTADYELEFMLKYKDIVSGFIDKCEEVFAPDTKSDPQTQAVSRKAS